jgi:hypothetical protein
MAASRGLLVCALASLSAWGPPAIAEPAAAPAAALLRRAVDADDLELAALSARLGDDAVLAALAPGSDVPLQLAAVRAAPFMRDKPLALEPLALIAQTRDPDLAPAAARRVLAIAQALELEDIASRELSPAAFEAAELRLDQLASSRIARVDIRLYAAEAAHLLRRLRGAP